MQTIIFCCFILFELSCFCQKGESFTDKRDKQTYTKVKIGEQVWMAENLRFATKSGSLCYENKKENCEKYGRLYNWNAAVHACPEGWRLPNEKDWEELERFLGMSKKEMKVRGWRGTDQGDRLKEGGDTGFYIKFSGYRHFKGKFYEIDHGTGFWSAKLGSDDDAIRRFFNAEEKGIDKDKEDMGNGYSVRCIEGDKWKK